MAKQATKKPAKAAAKKRTVHQDYLARMTKTLPSTPTPAPPLIVVEAPSKPLDTATPTPTPAPAPAPPAAEPLRSSKPAPDLFRTCERCLRKRPHDDVGPSKRLCPECWGRVNGAPVPLEVVPRNPYFRLRMSVEEAFLALRNGRYAAAMNVLDTARREHTPKASRTEP